MSALVQVTRLPILNRPFGYYLRWWYNGWHYWQFYAGDLTLATSGEDYRTYGTRTITLNSGAITYQQVSALRTVLNTTEVYLYTTYGWMLSRVDVGSVRVYDSRFGGYELTIDLTIGSKLPSETGFSPTVPVPVVPPSYEYCMVTLGTQVWLCRNYDIPYPNYKIYNNLPANLATWGGLYTYDQIMNTGFCPAGWHVPTEDEWQTCINFLGGLTVAGGKLKEVGTTHWDAPNTGAADTYGFAARGAGYYNRFSSAFLGQGQYTYFWTASAYGSVATVIRVAYDSGATSRAYVDRGHWLPLRLLKDGASDLNLSDLDGNPYSTVRVGAQEWIVQNLKVTQFSDGTPLAYKPVVGTFIGDTTGCYTNPNNDPANKDIYGLLYNSYAFKNPKGLIYFLRNGVHEAGWRMPTKADFTTLATSLGGALVAGEALKEVGDTHWTNMGYSNIATNSSGMTAVASGYIRFVGYQNFGLYQKWWANSLTLSLQDIVACFKPSAEFFYQTDNFGHGYCIRAMRDV
jgi:uncharacterized protein (TIGR02145 family)